MNDVELGDLDRTRGGSKLPHPGEKVYRFGIGTDLGGVATRLQSVYRKESLGTLRVRSDGVSAYTWGWTGGEFLRPGGRKNNAKGGGR